MKNLKLALMAAMIMVQGAMFAQTTIGLKTGLHIADVSYNDQLSSIIPNTSPLTGFTIGAISEIPLNSAISFRPELLYTRKGFTLEESMGVNVFGVDIPIGAKVETQVNYIEAPLLMKYTLGSEKVRGYAIAGPSIGYAANARIQPKATFIIDFNLPGTDINLGDNTYNRWELSGVIGAGGEMDMERGKIFADVRYTHGLSEVINDPIVNLNLANKGISLSAGYAMTF